MTSAAVLQGSILVHDHVMVDLIGADKIAPGRNDSEDVLRFARLMRRLSDAVEIEIWTNTGLYAAANTSTSRNSRGRKRGQAGLPMGGGVAARRGRRQTALHQDWREHKDRCMSWTRKTCAPRRSPQRKRV